MYFTLSNGFKVSCVADSSSAPEQGYIVEQLLLPLLALNNSKKEMRLIQEHCTMNELRVNADYRYEIDLTTKTIEFFEERYFYKTDAFRRGENLTDRYSAYLLTIPNLNAKP
jgi:hypothetical protein